MLARFDRSAWLFIATLVALGGCARAGGGGSLSPDAAMGDARDRDSGVPLVGNRDSDSDGLPDAEESMLGTDPYSTDSDGDGVSDLGEVRGSHTNPLDAASTVPEEDFFLVLPHGGGAVHETFHFGTRVDAADVYFLVDTTESMQSAIDSLRDSLEDIATEVSREVRSVQIGVGRFEDFPGDGLGEDFNVVYENMVDVSPDVAASIEAIGSLRARGGGDGPEADTQALFLLASGSGGSWSMRDGSTWSIAPRVCPEVPDESAPRIGHPCFRPGALPIVVHITNSAFHNGPTMYYRYATVTPEPALFADAENALVSIGARYIGVRIDDHGDHQAQTELARATGSVDVQGNVLYYDAVGGRVGPEIVEGIQTLLSRVPQDVEAVRRNVPGNPDDFDATQFIASLVALDGWNDATRGAAPGITYDRAEDATFYALVPGTQVSFDVTFENTVRAGEDSAQIFRAQIVVVGNRVADLAIRNVYVIVPPDGYEILI